MKKFIKKLFNLFYWESEEIMILNKNKTPIDSYTKRIKTGKLSKKVYCEL